MPHYGASTGANSGTSGVSCSLHDPGLVRLVDEKRRTSSKLITLVSPFIGKAFSLPYYERSLDRIPRHDCHAVFYDNSLDEKFSASIKKVLRRNFSSWSLIEDRNPPRTIENVVGIPERRQITARCAAVYSTIYSKYIPEDVPYVFNLEDDVEIPQGGFEKLISVLDSERRVGTVIAKCRDRRPGYGSTGKPIAFDFRCQMLIGSQSEPEAIELQQLPDKSFGIQAIGAGHMGCWLTRRDVLDRCQLGEESYLGVEGHDLVWGWRINRAGYLFATDWSVECRHWFEANGVAQSV